MSTLRLSVCVHSATHSECSASPGPAGDGRHHVEEFQFFEVRCRVDYAGTLAPSVECVPAPVAADNVRPTVEHVPSRYVVYTRRVQAFHNMTETVYNCSVRFRSTNQSCVSTCTCANNVPDFHFRLGSFVVAVTSELIRNLALNKLTYIIEYSRCKIIADPETGLMSFATLFIIVLSDIIHELLSAHWLLQ